MALVHDAKPGGLELHLVTGAVEVVCVVGRFRCDGVPHGLDIELGLVLRSSFYLVHACQFCIKVVINRHIKELKSPSHAVAIASCIERINDGA